MGLLGGLDPYNPMLNMGAALLDNGGYSDTPKTMGQGFAQAIEMMQKAQQGRQKQDLQAAQMQQEMLRSQQLQQMLAVNPQLLQAQLTQEQQKAQNMLQNNQNQQQFQQGIAGLLGSQPTTVNNFQGTGLLGGQMDRTQFMNQLAALAFQSGDLNTGVQLLQQANPLKTMTKEQQDLMAAGIDPNSAQGRQILQQQILGNLPQTKLQNEIQQQKMGVITREQAQADAKQLESSRTAADSALQVRNTLQNMKQISDQMSTFQTGRFLGPVATYLGAPLNQQMEQASNLLTVQAKNLLGFPNSGFSDADRDFLNKIAGGASLSKSNINATIDRMSKLTDIMIDKNRFYENRFYETGSLKNANSDFVDYLKSKGNSSNKSTSNTMSYGQLMGR